MLEEILQWDRDVLIFLNGLGSEAYDPFWSAATKILVWIPLFLFVVYKLFANTPRPVFLRILLELVLLVLTVQVLVFLVKTTTMRLRPINDPLLADMVRSVIRPSSYSFFSGHASSSFAVATFLYLAGRKYFRYISVIFLWAFFYTYSRLYLGVHYVSDILVGIIIGILLGSAFYRIHNIIHKKIQYS